MSLPDYGAEMETARDVGTSYWTAGDRGKQGERSQMMGAEGPRGKQGKILPRGRWGAEFDIRRPGDIPSEAEKPMGSSQMIR